MIPNNMRAAQVHELTGTGGVRIAETQVPNPGPHEVLIAVESCGLSFADLLMAKGAYQLIPELPFTIGMDLAGTVAASGAEVTRFSVGDRVAASVPHGGAAEYAVAADNLVFSLPEEVAFTTGAALPTNYLTADFVLRVRAGLHKGETVLVHGASGGVGSAAVQLAGAMGARVLAVVSTDEKAEFARRSGAQEVVFVDGFKDRVMQLTNNEGVDVVVDPVGASVLDESLRCLKMGGRHMVVGFAGGGDGPPSVKVNRLLFRNIDVRGAGWGGYLESDPANASRQWEALLPLLHSGAVSPAIGKVFSFADIADGLAALESRTALGKVVISTH